MSSEDGRRALLSEVAVEIEGRMPWSSNSTFLVTLCTGEVDARAIYKPERGERPLWDFPGGLWRREVAAYELSEALGWSLVPTTVGRDDLPLGPGSLQWFVEADFEQHYFTIHERACDAGDAVCLERLRLMCAFDIVANNTDRKSGHVLLGPDGDIAGIDHGLCFHEDWKLRTVIWEFGGEDLPARVTDDLARFALRGAPDRLADWLTLTDCQAMLARAAELVDAGVFPIDATGRRYPWPLV